MNKPLAVLVTILVIVVLSACQGIPTPQPLAGSPATQSAMHDSGAPGPVHCNIMFKAQVHQGASNGLALKGMFDFKLNASGVLTGTLTQADQSEVKVSGQVHGQAINLAFTVGNSTYVFGVGTALKPIDNETCGDTLGGPFVGPKAGDAGDWLAKQGTQPGSCIGNNDW